MWSSERVRYQINICQEQKEDTRFIYVKEMLHMLDILVTLHVTFPLPLTSVTSSPSFHPYLLGWVVRVDIRKVNTRLLIRRVGRDRYLSLSPRGGLKRVSPRYKIYKI